MFRVKTHPEKPLIWWHEYKTKINMSPTYQRRGGLWSSAKKALLIDSVLNEYDIPKIYLADFTYADTSLNEAKTPYAVIDGKQRFEAFFDFFDGRLELRPEFKYYDEPDIDLGKLNYFDLKEKYPRIAQRFERYIPSIMSVITDEPAKVDEMFVRLNSGMNIKGAEKRNAMPGPIPELIRRIAAHPFFSTKISFNTLRMQEYNTAAKILLFEHKNRFVDTKARNLDSFVLDYMERPIEEFTADYEEVVETLDRMTTIFSDRDPVLGTEGPVPLYYWFVRHLPENSVKVREFLKEFKDDIKSNLAVSQETPRKADAELTTYYTMSRTTNDQGSLAGRYEILKKRYKSYLSKRQK
jgi:hypothetical protein